MRLYHDQALFKEPGGGRTPWHQDQFYWPFDSGDTITMWMPLVDVAPEVGSMRFVAGSHRLGHVSGESISDESDREVSALIAERDLRSRPTARWRPATPPSTPAGRCTRPVPTRPRPCAR